MKHLGLGVVLSLASAGTAQAAAPIAANAICIAERGAHNGSPLLLDYLLLKGVSLRTIDRNADGPTLTEVYETLVDEAYCDRDAAVPCQEGDADKLSDARNLLAGFLADHPGVEFDWKRAPTSMELEAEPWLKDAFIRLADPARRFVAMRCDPPPEVTSDTASRLSSNEKRDLNLGMFLLARDVAGLTTPRGKRGSPNRLKNVPQAEISFIDDNASDTETLSVNAAAGLAIVDRVDFKLIPFVQLVRSHVGNTKGGPDKDLGKLSLGALMSFMPTSDDQIDVAPLYSKDLEAGAEIIGGRVAWRPGFLYRLPSFQGSQPVSCTRNSNGRCIYGTTTLALWSDVQFVTSFGRVLNEGTDPKLTEGRDFLRAGPDARLTLYGIRGPFRDFALDLAYKRLFRLTGDGRDVTQFRAGLSYWIAGSEHVALRYGYEKGTDEDTLVRFDLWRLGLGVRF
jgi:hypothetical protein